MNRSTEAVHACMHHETFPHWLKWSTALVAAAVFNVPTFQRTPEVTALPADRFPSFAHSECLADSFLWAIQLLDVALRYWA